LMRGFPRLSQLPLVPQLVSGGAMRCGRLPSGLDNWTERDPLPNLMEETLLTRIGAERP